MLDKFSNICAGADRRIEDVYVLVNQAALKVQLAEPIGALDHESDNLVRCIDHPESVSSLWVVDFIEVFVDSFKKRLLFVMSGNLCGGSSNGRVIRRKCLQGLMLSIT